MKKILTAEFVSPSHPDKMCDRISDAILEKFVSQDKNSRVAVETLGGHGRIYIIGEVTSLGNLDQADYKQIVDEVTGNDSYEVTVHIVKQSPEIASGVDAGGAGDQGIVVGYACNENDEMIPQEYYLAKTLCMDIYKDYPFDGKTQVTLNEDFEVLTVVTSYQNVSNKIIEEKIQAWIEKYNVKTTDETRYLLNPAGEWSQGGFDADTGLTGRKIVVDSYGPRVPIGGGAFSGKDWTKVDRSGAAYAQHIAQQMLKKHAASEVRVELAYAIGIPESVGAIAYVDGQPQDIIDFDTGMKGIEEFMDRRG